MCHCVSSRNLKNYAALTVVGLLRQRQKILFSKRRPSFAEPVQLAGTFVPWAFDVRYLDLLLDSKLLYNKYLRTVTKTAKGVFCHVFPVLAQESTLSQKTQTTLCKSPVRSIMTYVAPCWSSTCDSNYLKFQVVENRCWREAGHYPTGTLMSHLHETLKEEPIQNFIHQLTLNFFFTVHHILTPGSKNRKLHPTYLNPMYKKCKSKHTCLFYYCWCHSLLYLTHQQTWCFFIFFIKV